MTSHHADLSLSRLEEYYRGCQPLSYLDPQLRLATDGRLRNMVINIPRLVVDSIEDRLDVEGFRLPNADGADADLWRIWQANDLDEWSQQAHLEALIYGRSFVIVWANPDDPTTPRITVESARQIEIEYDATRRNVVRAVKHWQDGDREMQTVYGPDVITRWWREPARQNQPARPWQPRAEPIPNVFGVVPVVPFVNRPTLTRPMGESEMTDVLPIADALNKLGTDLMVTAEFTAMPRRYATGMAIADTSDPERERLREEARRYWSQAEKDRVWIGGTGANFGQFQTAGLDNYTTAMDMLTARAAALSGLPPHYFGQAGENPASADALRASEASLVKRALRKQRVFGGAWERVMRLAALVRDGEPPTGMNDLETIWRDAETPTVAQKADAAVKLLQAEAVDVEQVQEDLGYTPVQIKRMRDRREAAALGPVSAQIAEAQRLEREEGLPRRAAFAAVGLLQAAAAMGPDST